MTGETNEARLFRLVFSYVVIYWNGARIFMGDDVMKDKYCLMCGECCKFLTFTIGGLSTNRIYKDYYQKHGCTIKGDKLSVPIVCPQLKDNQCTIHDKKPFLCKQYRGQVSDKFEIPNGCGFK